MKKIVWLILLVINQLHAGVLELNHDHSKILFDIDYMKLTTVQGQFKDYSGSMLFSTAENEISDLKVNIVAASVDTNEPKRDFHIKGQEFFLVATYPEITFEAKGPISLAMNKSFKLPGTLTLRGIKKPIVFEGIYKGKMTDPWKKENYFFDFKTQVNRQDFGMKWNKELDNGGYLVGDLIRINVSVQAQPVGDKTAFSTHMIPSTKGIIERDQLKKGKIKKLSTSTDPKDHAN